MDESTDFSTLIHEIFTSASALLQRTDYLSEYGFPNLDKISPIYADLNLLMQHMMQNPQVTTDCVWPYFQEAQNLVQTQNQYWSGLAAMPDLPKGSPFKAEEWANHPFFQGISQHYRLLENGLRNLVMHVPETLHQPIKRIQFLIQQAYQALSPENFILSNPQLLNATLASNGLNLLQGLRHFLQDLQNKEVNIWTLPLADKTAFAVGQNLAVTPGKVVYQNDLIELILYTPQTETVSAIPLLMIPPWINKYYILDLRPENSLVRWLVEQGITVFMISWRNPEHKDAHLSLDDYLKLGPIAAISAIQKILHVDQVSTLGFCIGGTLLSMLLAYYQAQNLNCIASATFLASLIDFSEPGDLGVFIHEQQIQLLEKNMQEHGYLGGNVMAAAFNSLRPNDLIWKILIHRYLLGQSPAAFDLLFWNMDTTNMPAKMHSEYLRNCYLENNLIKPGKLCVNEVPIDITAITTPAFFLSTQKDHIALWQSTYKGFQLLKGPKTFVLGGSGHIAGIVIPPGKDKYGYHTYDDECAAPEEWLAKAEYHPGSWWPVWLDWLQPFSGPKMPATMINKQLSKKEYVAAPGKYVHNKSSVTMTNTNEVG